MPSATGRPPRSANDVSLRGPPCPVARPWPRRLPVKGGDPAVERSPRRDGVKRGAGPRRQAGHFRRHFEDQRAEGEAGAEKERERGRVQGRENFQRANSPGGAMRAPREGVAGALAAMGSGHLERRARRSASSRAATTADQPPGHSESTTTSAPLRSVARACTRSASAVVTPGRPVRIEKDGEFLAATLGRR